MSDITDAAREAEVALRPGKTDDIKDHTPAGLRETTNPEPSYKAAQAARKPDYNSDKESDMQKSLSWNAQQKKVAEGQ